jgi:hypothetical protein
MSSGAQIVAVADQWLQGDKSAYEKSAKKYRHTINRGISTFSWFIYRFTTPEMVTLFRDPKNIFKIEQAVISMLAGDVYASAEIRLRLLVFKIIYTARRMLNTMRRHPTVQ